MGPVSGQRPRPSSPARPAASPSQARDFSTRPPTKGGGDVTAAHRSEADACRRHAARSPRGSSLALQDETGRCACGRRTAKRIRPCSRSLPPPAIAPRWTEHRKVFPFDDRGTLVSNRRERARQSRGGSASDDAQTPRETEALACANRAKQHSRAEAPQWRCQAKRQRLGASGRLAASPPHGMQPDGGGPTLLSTRSSCGPRHAQAHGKEPLRGPLLLASI
jgi:hypothetical protein